MKVKERIHRKEEMSSYNVEALTIRKAKEKEFKDLWIVTHLSSFYSRRWRKNNFLRKSPDDTKKEDNDERDLAFRREDTTISLEKYERQEVNVVFKEREKIAKDRKDKR